MNPTTTGWVIFISALGMMCGLLSTDIARLTDWNGVFRPPFVAIVMAHFGSVVLAFVGGKLIPENRSNKQTRATDSPIILKDEK